MKRACFGTKLPGKTVAGEWLSPKAEATKERRSPLADLTVIGGATPLPSSGYVLEWGMGGGWYFRFSVSGERGGERACDIPERDRLVRAFYLRSSGLARDSFPLSRIDRRRRSSPEVCMHGTP